MKACARSALCWPKLRPEAPFGNSNGQQDKSDSSDQQFAMLKKKLTLAQRDCKSQEPTTSRQGEYGKGTCRTKFQEQEGGFFGR